MCVDTPFTSTYHDCFEHFIADGREDALVVIAAQSAEDLFQLDVDGP